MTYVTLPAPATLSLAPAALPQAAVPRSAATVAIPKPLPKPGEQQPEWINIAFAALSTVALILAVVWLRRRGRGPWR